VRVWGAISLLWAVTGVAVSPWLRVREVRVVGLERGSGEEVERVVGSLLGKPLLSLAPLKAARGIERLPWVREVRVSVKLPGEVVLCVRERKAVFWVSGSGGRGLALSADGVALGWAEWGGGLCRLEGLPPPDGPGKIVGGDKFLALRGLYFALRRAGVRGIEAVGVRGGGALFATFKNGTVITFGGLAGVEEKAERARALLHFLGGRRAYVELLSPDLAVCRPLRG